MRDNEIHSTMKMDEVCSTEAFILNSTTRCRNLEDRNLGDNLEDHNLGDHSLEITT
jgi:hypothetical protein